MLGEAVGGLGRREATQGLGLQNVTLFVTAGSTSFRTYVYEKILSPPLAPYQINPLSLQSDEVPKQTIGKDYLHGINRFLHFEFPTFSYWRSNCWPSFFLFKNNK